MQLTSSNTSPALPVLRPPVVLLIDEDRAQGEIVAERLLGDEIDVLLGWSAEAAASKLRRGPADLVIVRGSLQPVERLRAAGLLAAGCPVIALCDGGAEARASVLRRGADDAISIPVHGPELSERVRLALLHGGTPPAERLDAIGVRGGLRVDLASRDAEIRGQRITLTCKEFELLAVMARDPERVFLKAELMREVWDHHILAATTRTLDSHMCRLRGKLAEAGGQYVANRWGIGYRLLPFD